MTNDYEALMHVIRRRRSIRRFRAESVPQPLLERLIEAARWAPSAGNRQGYRFLVATDRALLAQMGDAVHEAARELLAAARPDMACDLDRYVASFEHFRTAPVVLACMHRAGLDLLAASTEGATRLQASERSRLDALASASAAMMNLLLAADSLGLAGCWMTGPLIAERRLRVLLAIPEGWELAALIPVGYPDEAPPPPARRPLARLWKYLDAPGSDEKGETA